MWHGPSGFPSSVGLRASYVQVAEPRLAGADRLQFLIERLGGRVPGVGHRLGVTGELHHGDVVPGAVDAADTTVLCINRVLE